ncbi:MAG: DNA-nicking Smr family endonuclease [Halocynthiibacter sp.]|jgi:DNA-nicking Smr family endonuclease
MGRNRRQLHPEEEALWDLVRRNTRALHPERPLRAPEEKQARPAPKKAKHAHFSPFALGQAAKPSPRNTHDIAPKIGEALATASISMDRKSFGRMKKGKLSPEARIDLHGMTIAQAHPALLGFVQRAYSDGKRLVLVITGKGKHRDDGGPIPVRHGVLKHQVPHWLHSAPLSPLILQISEAHLRHGGTGAYYVYLRRAGR